MLLRTPLDVGQAIKDRRRRLGWDQDELAQRVGASRKWLIEVEMAGLAPSDIDVAQIYDCFTITVPMTLEDYGFCAKGQGGSFVSGGRIDIDGDLPVNTSGGLLSETGMPGLQLVIEGVRQMRGQANLQVPNAKTCIVSNQGGVMTTHATLILGQ